MDRVFIEALEIECVIGIYDWERKIRQPIVLDIGGSIQGYGSDITRTLWVTGGDPANGPDERFRHLFGILHAAQAAATRSVRPGVTPESVDAAARGPIEATLDRLVPPPGEYVADGAARQAAWVLSGASDAPTWSQARDGVDVVHEPTPVPEVRAAYGAARTALYPS